MPHAASCRLCSASAGNFPMISDDLVNSYHLLLCALDLVLTNALLCNARKELLNPDFRGSHKTHQLIRTSPDKAVSGQRSSCQSFYSPLFSYCTLQGKDTFGPHRVLDCSSSSRHFRGKIAAPPHCPSGVQFLE